MTRASALCLALATHLLGCSSSTSPPAAKLPRAEPSSSPTAARGAPAATGDGLASPLPLAEPDRKGRDGAERTESCPALASGDGPAPHPCGELACRAYPSPEAALAAVLRENDPRILAVGEAHLRAELAHLTSATRRFSALLHLFSCRARHLVIELLLGRSDCGDNRVERTEELQKPVTKSQARSNQQDFLELGFAAQRLGIAPRALTPTCEVYGRVTTAGPDSVMAMLDAIGATTADSLTELLQVTPSRGTGSLLLAYGGALHNDLVPRPGFEQASFAPRLDALTRGGLVELDLVVREQVTDSEPWTLQPFYAAYQPHRFPDLTLLYQTGPRSFTLVFPRSP